MQLASLQNNPLTSQKSFGLTSRCGQGLSTYLLRYLGIVFNGSQVLGPMMHLALQREVISTSRASKALSRDAIFFFIKSNAVLIIFFGGESRGYTAEIVLGLECRHVFPAAPIVPPRAV